jgi:tRNA threonylcarbamoyladenosine biosynthesis protein TsaE
MPRKDNIIATWITESSEETEELGEELLNRLDESSTLGLVGSLGTGKTTLVKGIIDALGGDRDAVRSPTYTLINRYDDVAESVVHADLYRAESETQQETIGLESFFDTKLLLVEWADRWVFGWPSNTVTLLLEHTGPSERSLQLVQDDPATVVKNENVPLNTPGGERT